MNTPLILIICLHLPIVCCNYSALTYDKVMTPEWQKLESAPQYVKDHTLMNAMRMPNTYSAKRWYIAAAIHAGASVPIAQLRTSSEAPFKLLPNAVLMQDLPLIRLLLAHGADVDERGFVDLPAIYFADNAQITQELIDYGAWEILTQEEKTDLLLHAMRAGFSADLITLYRQQGLNPMVCDNGGWTPLMHLAARPEQDTIAKAAALLQGLSRKETVRFIRFRAHNSRENIFDVIHTTKRTCNEHELAELKNLRTFLEQKLYQDSCVICCDPLDIRTCAYINRHRLHATCSTWAQQNIKSMRSK